MPPEAIQRKVPGRPLIGGTLSVAALTALARLNGGVREVLIARDFGTSAALEAFLVGFGVVTLIVVAVTGAMPGALVPTYYRTGEMPDERRGSNLLAALLGRLVLWLVGGAVVLAITAGPIAAVVGGGFDDSTERQLRQVIVLLAPVLPVAGLASLFTSMINARQRFAVGAVPQVINPVTTVAVIALTVEPRASTLAVAFLAGYTAELLLSVVLAIVSGVGPFGGSSCLGSDNGSIRFARAWKRGEGDSKTCPGPYRDPAREDRRVFFSLFLPMFAAFAVQASGTVIDQAVASHLPSGQVAVLAFGSRVTGFAVAVGITAVGTVVLPQFSMLASSGQGAALARSLRSKVVTVACVGLAAALVLAVASESILQLLFGRGRFTAADVEAAAQVQAVAAWQIPVQLVLVLYLKALSAGHRQNVILLVSLAAAALNFVLDVAFAAWFGVRGIALSTTAVLASTCLVYRRIVNGDLERLTVGSSG